MMNYKLIRLSSDPKVIGVNNGSAQIELNCRSLGILGNDSDKVLGGFVWKDGAFKSFLKDNGLEAINMQLLRQAKLTDFMTHSPDVKNSLFTVSETCFSLLTQFELDGYEAIKVNLLHNGKKLNESYRLIIYPHIGFEDFDFEESIMYTGNELRGKSYQKIYDFLQFQDLIENDPFISFEKAVIRAKGKMFNLLNVGGIGLFMSERLIDACIKAGLTGLNIPKVAPMLELR